jgi:glutamyl-Q tRNA(Asp) synthetase
MWTDLTTGKQFADPIAFGDVVLWRKDAPASYHLAATVDDAADGITYVVRGKDLFAYTAIHRLLQTLLDLPEPVYWHHPLLLDSADEKLAKSKSSPALSARRLASESSAELMDNLRHRTLPLGISVSDA